MLKHQLSESLHGESDHPHLQYALFVPARKRFSSSTRLYLSTVHYSTNRLLLASLTPNQTLGRSNLLLRINSQLYFQFARLYTTHYWLVASLLHQTVQSALPLFSHAFYSAPKTDKGSYALLTLVRNLKLL